MENVLIGIITAHIRHGTNQMEGNRIAHVVIGNVIVTRAVAAVLIIFVVFQNFLFHSGRIGLDSNVDVPHHLQQRCIVSTAFSNIFGGINNQIITVSQSILSAGQHGARTGLICVGKFRNSIGKHGIGIIISQDLCNCCRIGAVGEQAAIRCVSLQSLQKGLGIDAAAPLDIGQNAAFLTAGENLVSGKGVVFQDSIAGHRNRCRKRGEGQGEDHGQGQQNAGQFFEMLHCACSFLWVSLWDAARRAYRAAYGIGFLRCRSARASGRSSFLPSWFRPARCGAG